VNTSAIAALICGTILTGCAFTGDASHLEGQVSPEQARRIAADLVGVMRKTEGVHPSMEPVCFISGVTNGSLSVAFQQALRSSGLAVNETQSSADGSSACFRYRLSVLPGLTPKVKFATTCLDYQSGSLCREYELPDAQPRSAYSLLGLSLSTERSLESTETRNGCREAALVEAVDIDPMPGSRLRAPVTNETELRTIAARLRAAGSCILLRTADNDLSLDRVEAIEDSLRSFGVPSQSIYRLIEPDASRTMVAVELRREGSR